MHFDGSLRVLALSIVPEIDARGEVESARVTESFELFRMKESTRDGDNPANVEKAREGKKRGEALSCADARPSVVDWKLSAGKRRQRGKGKGKGSWGFVEMPLSPGRIEKFLAPTGAWFRGCFVEYYLSVPGKYLTNDSSLSWIPVSFKFVDLDATIALVRGRFYSSSWKVSLLRQP